MLPFLQCLEHPFGRQQSHLLQRLADGGDAGSRDSGWQHIVKAQHRTILRYTQTGFGETTHHAQGGQIVEGEDCREGFTRGQHSPRAVQPSLKSRGWVYETGQLKHQFFIQLDAGLGSGLLHPCPARRAVEKFFRTADDRDPAMAQFDQVAHRQYASRFVVHQQGTDPTLG